MHYLGLVVAYTWNREKQMFVALGKEFDINCLSNCEPGMFAGDIHLTYADSDVGNTESRLSEDVLHVHT